MKIGIDAKRIFLNNTGLGSYGRNLMNGFKQIQNEDEYVLYSPKKKKLFSLNGFPENFKSFFSSAKIKAFWRSYSILKNLKKDEINIYHGISNELPFSLKKEKEIVKIVDIHDLLFLRFPEFYALTDRKMFEFKTKFACEIADKIIATSEATKQDIIKYYGTEEAKIEVVYQSCDDKYFETVPDKLKQSVAKKYHLPKQFILCVGTIQERKNQMMILEAMQISKHKIPIVIIGSGDKYKTEIIKYAEENNIALVIPESFVKDEHLPAIYQMAKLFVFPGLYEGFGIPVLEAMASKTPIITSMNTSMAEIVQHQDCLINPLSVSDLSEKIDLFLEKDNSEMIAINHKRSLEFTNKKFATRISKIYDVFRN